MAHRLLTLFGTCLLGYAAYGQSLESLDANQNNAPIIIDAEESVVCDETAHKCVATGHARAQKGTSVVYGDVLTVYFTEDKDITVLTADGHVRMETPTETAYGNHAHYDVALDRLLMTGGNLKLVSPKQTLTATDSVEYWRTKRQGIARGNAVVDFPEKQELIQGNIITANFCSATNDGNKVEIETIEATGNFLASSPNGVVTGNRAVYHAQTQLVEVFGNVKIVQGENIIQGEYGRANLKTNLAEIFPCEPGDKPCGPPRRISGVIVPRGVKRSSPPCP